MEKILTVVVEAVAALLAVVEFLLKTVAALLKVAASCLTPTPTPTPPTPQPQPQPLPPPRPPPPRPPPRMIYLSSSGEDHPDLGLAIKAFLQEKKVVDKKVANGGKVVIIELNDGNDQPIYKAVEQHVKALGYSTEATAYKFFEEKKGVGTKLIDLLDKLAQPGTICIVGGGNTWQLSYAFGQNDGVRATIKRQVQCGDLMYVSFSAGSVMAGLTVEIDPCFKLNERVECRDDGKEWCVGRVVSVEPLKVQPDGAAWTAGYTWDEVRVINPVLHEGGTRTKDGFKLVQYAIRPHNNHKWSQDAGKEFERKLAAKEVKDDGGKVIPKCPVRYLEDGQACVFTGGADEPIMLPDTYAKDKIVKCMPSLIFEVCDAKETAVVGNAFKIFAKTPGLVVKRVVRNDNETQYKIYEAERDQIMRLNDGNPNEVWLFNGNDSVFENMKNGFMTQYASQEFNAYGVGIYFAADPRLSMYFERKTRDQGMGVPKTILLARVTLGKMGVRAYVPPGPANLTRPESKLPTPGYHSNTSQANIEAIVYENHRAFPTYLIEYESPPARDPYDQPLKGQLRKIRDAEERDKQPKLHNGKIIRWVDDLTA